VNDNFRHGFYAGLLVAAVLGIYLFQLWQPERQVTLHSANLIEALEENDWSDLADFIADNYEDRWGHDRAVVLLRLREVLSYAPNLQIEAIGVAARADDQEGTWSARIQVEADPNEVTALIKGRVNPLDAPFELQWRRQSWKPWDWKLVRVDNPALELTSRAF